MPPCLAYSGKQSWCMITIAFNQFMRLFHRRLSAHSWTLIYYAETDRLSLSPILYKSILTARDLLMEPNEKLSWLSAFMEATSLHFFQRAYIGFSHNFISIYLFIQFHFHSHQGPGRKVMWLSVNTAWFLQFPKRFSADCNPVGEFPPCDEFIIDITFQFLVHPNKWTPFIQEDYRA